MSLYPFQIEAVKKSIKFLKTNSAVYNASDPGLGKTLMTLSTITKIKSLQRVLIICPASVKYNWLHEIKTWTQYKKKDIQILNDSKDVKNYKDVTFTILSYKLTISKSVLELLTSKLWDVIILDEAHACKNITAKRTKVILKDTIPKCKYKFFLSGTPFTQSLADGFPIFNTILPDIFTNFYKFVAKYCYAKRKFLGYKTVTTYYGAKNTEDLKKIINSNFFIRYRKQDVLKDLPGKLILPIYLSSKLAVNPETEEEKSAMQDVKKEKPKAISFGKLANLIHSQGKVKVPSVIGYIEETFIPTNTPVVVFGVHKAILQALKDTYPEASYIDGAVTSENRMKEIADFQSGKTNIMISQIVAGGIGTNMQRASNVLFAELTWDPSQIQQAIDRCNRIGSINTCTVHIPIVSDSIEESMFSVVNRKIKDFDKVLN